MYELSAPSLICLVVVLAMLGGVGNSQVAAAAAAVIVYDHGFSEQVNYTSNGNIKVTKTYVFTQDDHVIDAYAIAAFYVADFTWQWVDPSGGLYYNRTQPEQCVVTPCPITSEITMAGSDAATRFGVWTVNLLANGFPVYSDQFTLLPVITEEDHWSFDVVSSAPPSVHVGLTVTIHPDNQTWRYYTLGLPPFANLTAHDSQFQSLEVTTATGGFVVVNLGSPRADGYTFVLTFDLLNGVNALSSWNAGNFAFIWQVLPWMTHNDVHPIPESFNITLPRGATFVDAQGMNTLSLHYDAINMDRFTIFVNTTLAPTQSFGWSILYRDFTYQELHPNVQSSTSLGLALASNAPVPVLPLTFGEVSLWAAILSVFVLTSSELLTPIYSRTRVLINRKRLRMAALILVLIFLTSTAYQILLSNSTVVSR